MAFYNIYIEHSIAERDYIIALNDEQLSILVDAYLAGEISVMVKGVKRNINNPKKFLIYSITELEHISNDQAKIESHLKSAKMKLNNRKMSLGIYSRFGTNITDVFTKCKGWGSFNSTKEQTKKVNIENYEQGRIFISHSVLDKQIVLSFTEQILELGLGLKASEDIFNISIEDSGIISGEKFKERIENELKKSKAVIQIITENYKKSEACMNEMGAAWILDTEVIPFILDPISYNSAGFIHNTTQLLKLNSKVDLKKFVADYKGVLFPLNYHDSKLDRKIDEFLKVINTKNTSNENKIESTIIDLHIEQGYKNFQTDNPFIKINNHSNPYYYVNKKFREIKDEATLMFLGYNLYKKTNQMNLTNDELKRNIGDPITILNSEIWVSVNDNKQWLIYDNFRHHILDGHTAAVMKKIKKSELIYKYVTSDDLEKLIQGNSFTLKEKIN